MIHPDTAHVFHRQLQHHLPLAVPGYFKAIRALCDRHGIMLILDEVMCGMGRTGTLHACEHEAVVPDLLDITKGLGGGCQPIGAVLAQKNWSMFSALTAACFSTAIPTWATPWPALRRWRCSVSLRATV